MKHSVFGMAFLIATIVVAIATPTVPTVPSTVRLPELEPLVPACADPAADRFLEIDISQRPPPGALRVQKLSGWVTPDGMFHWPFVMRVRNIGDQPFVGKPGMQSATLTETDGLMGNKSRLLADVRFDRIAAHSGVAVRFEFTAPAPQVQSGRFQRAYTLAIKYNQMDQAIATGRNGDCNLQNNRFAIEINGAKKGWIFAK